MLNAMIMPDKLQQEFCLRGMISCFKALPYEIWTGNLMLAVGRQNGGIDRSGRFNNLIALGYFQVRTVSIATRQHRKDTWRS